jgi:hypothetical protein
MYTLYGTPIKIATQRNVRKFSISDDVQLSESVRVEMNEWCAEFFGTFPVVMMSTEEVYRMADGTLLMSQATYDALCEVMDEENSVAMRGMRK